MIKLDNLEKAVGMPATSLKDSKKFAGGKLLDHEMGAMAMASKK